MSHSHLNSALYRPPPLSLVMERDSRENFHLFSMPFFLSPPPLKRDSSSGQFINHFSSFLLLYFSFLRVFLLLFVVGRMLNDGGPRRTKKCEFDESNRNRFYKRCSSWIDRLRPPYISQLGDCFISVWEIFLGVKAIKLRVRALFSKQFL